jgi:pyruvate dehydrogenase E2 component (dihydrolipoamide acetyltransferase)
MPDVVMPRLSESMQEGTILGWLKASGEHVAAGEELVEIETDKATVVYEAEEPGVLEILADAGATLPVGLPIARIAQAAPDGHRQPDPAPVSGTVPASPQAAGTGKSISASPIARRLAHELDVDLASVEGSGPGGRIVRADVEARARRRSPAAAGPEASPADPRADGHAGADLPPDGDAGARGEVTPVRMSRLQQTVARRMAHVKATVPEFTVTIDADMDAAVALHAEAKTASTEADGPTINDMIVKAAALALHENPHLNGACKDDSFELYGRVNVGVAVATPDALLVPTIFDADLKPLDEIARATRALAARARAGKITPQELSGGTFTVSNLGMFGASSFTAIINAGQAAILAVGALRDEAVARNGTVALGVRMTLTLTCDHRIVYGAQAASFLQRIRELLEAPRALLSAR